METTNPNGSESQSQGTTVQDAASSFLGLMDAAEAPEGQVEAQTEQPEEELELSEDEQQDWQDDGEQEEPEPESDDQEEEVEQTFSVKVAGEEKELTLSELKTLAQQGADYTDRKSVV